ncbi:hypothetical protein LSTR_LSTR011374 [Laodelphax striatellus]|uniref:Nucleoporin Nup188 N-terminal subdomain III domain-containing protein n=1 Tax=Laodelphax striatellus TaxID=195883 RepID=A0A482XUB6_LAOST|nr:hypothetical protein LSTR_LSTR011374 [Laodelphax striatellus]
MSTKEPLAYWRGRYELISGLKSGVSHDYMKDQLNSVGTQILEGLNYFKRSQGGNQEEDASKKSKDSKLNNLVKKLSTMIKLEHSQTWEVLSNYLLYAFRGPAESLKKILISESKVNAVLADMFCFYCRERMFLLKSLTHIVTKLDNDPHSELYKEFLNKISFSKLYNSLSNQMESVKLSEPPEITIPGSISTSPLVNFWMEYNLLEQIQLMKLLILVYPNIEPSMKHMDAALTAVIKSGSAKRPGALSKNDPHRQSLLKVLWDLEAFHFIQLLSLEKLPGECIWTDREMFLKMDKQLKQSYRFDASGALFSAWMVVTFLSPFRPADSTELLSLATAVKQLNAWAYLDKFLNSSTIKDEPTISSVAHQAVYALLYLAVENFGIDFVRDEPSVYSLTATLVRDDSVEKRFWENGDCGLIKLLEEAEYWFPEVWQPAIGILGSLACKGKSQCMKVLERLNNNMKYCQKNLGHIRLNALHSNVFESCEDVHPLPHRPEIVIPKGTRCSTTATSECELVHWHFSLSSQAASAALRGNTSFQNDSVAYSIAIRNVDLKERIIGLFKFSTEILKTIPVLPNDMLIAIEEVFNLMHKNYIWRQESELDLLISCLDMSSCLVGMFSDDILKIFQSLNFLPEIDHVVMTHVQCVQGFYYRGGQMKSILELVEINSGRFRFLISYLRLLHKLFKVEATRVSWLSLAGLMFVLRDVFPHYQSWYFVDETERVEIGWLCLHILHMSLNGSKQQLQLPPEAATNATAPAPSPGPTFNLIANTCLYSLLNKDAGIALIRIVALGEQKLFDMVEKFPSWNNGKSAMLISTVHYALSVLNRIILYKDVQQDPSKLSPTEEEIYKEPKDTDRFHCVLNVASYIHHSFNPKLRYLACRLLTRFADNTRLSLMLCTGLEPYTIRDMFLQPLYSEYESVQLKVAVLEFISKCIHRQASLAEAFLNVVELKECISSGKDQQGSTSGVLTFALCIICDASDFLVDPVYHATVDLLHALWLEQCSVVLSYLRGRKGFWESLCKPLFEEEPCVKHSVYTSIMNILSTEVYWYGKDINPCLNAVMVKFLDEKQNYFVNCSLLCTNSSYNSSSESVDKRSQLTDDLIVAWREFVITVVKFLPDLVSDHLKGHLTLLLINALAAEMTSIVNMNAIVGLSEAGLMLISMCKECRTKKGCMEQMVRILAKLSQHYIYIKPKAITMILAFSARLLDVSPVILPEDGIELLMESVCEVIAIEVDLFINSCQDRSRPNKKNDKLMLALCLALRLQALLEDHTGLVETWTKIIRSMKFVHRLISAIATSLKCQIEPKLCLFMLEFLLALTNKESLFRHIDMFDLNYYIWENIPQCTAGYPNEAKADLNSQWKPVYCRGLNLVTFLLENNSRLIRASTYDFIELHQDYLEELLKLLQISDDEIDLELVSAGLRLLSHIITDNVFSKKSRNQISRLMISVYNCVKVVVNLLLHPNTLISQFYSPHPRKPLSIESKPLDQSIVKKAQSAQIKLGVPPWAMQPPLDMFEPMDDFSVIVNAINQFTKILMKTMRASTPVSGETEETASLTKLPAVKHDDLRFALEISNHLLISKFLLIIVDDRLSYRDKQLFIRDLSSELNSLLDFNRRLKIDPRLQRLELEEFEDDSSAAIQKPLRWPDPPPEPQANDANSSTRNSVRRNMFPSDESSGNSNHVHSASKRILPMDFIQFSVDVLQMLFKISESRAVNV